MKALSVILAMPSRKITAHCPQCREQNHIRAEYCNRCGEKLDRPKIPRISPGLESRLDKDRPRDAVYHIDVAHPISREFRTNIERLVGISQAEARLNIHAVDRLVEEQE